MLSILIPVYNYNIFSMVSQIHNQVSDCHITFEIRVYDDGSKQFSVKNNAISNLSNTTYKELPNNIGRSAIRNLLAAEAKYDLLLFIDAGTVPKSDNFIKDYLDHPEYSVVSGGMTYLSKPPKKPFTLRWAYTKKRESSIQKPSHTQPVICSSNFLIQKEIFKRNPFDESLKKYGCEDVLFFDGITKKGIPIKHINNPVIHDAQDDATTFIKKTETAIENLIELIDTKKLPRNRYKVSKLYYKLERIRLDTLISLLFKATRNILKMNFNSSYPSILCYDLYRLGYFCLIKNKK
ncbi:glycosyltransferase [Aquimarina addita]|uniref:Glycosyltransferase n=1 Tax=Aquimarina addita TaxID=870485 RepID=A0ABP7X9B5_9FLAO